jgi:hypothetical protein
MNKQQAIVMWVIWFAMLQFAFVVHFIVGGGFPSGENAVEPMAAWLWIACFVPLVAATLLRWLVMPKIKEQARLLVAMVIGLALSEQPILISLFLIGADYPQIQIGVLCVSVVSLIQFAPSYGTPGYNID